MASNQFGTLFRITTWGESHGQSIGVVIDGCPAGVEISVEEINLALLYRSPGSSSFVTARKEVDKAEILSGIFEGKTTGAPLSIQIKNHDVDSTTYEVIKEVYRPGHANFTYLQKYGIFDYRGGGRASARETACRVAAGAVAKKILSLHEIELFAYLHQVGSLICPSFDFKEDFHTIKKQTVEDVIFCPDTAISEKIRELILSIKEQGNSLGGVVQFVAKGLPPGLGDPIYQKLDAKLSFAMMSIPASRGFEIGSGFECAKMTGSESNDLFTLNKNQISTESNHCGGILGGITTGMPLFGKVAFKPTSSIKIDQKSVNLQKEEVQFILPKESRHDPCVAIRAVPVVEAMLALVLVDVLLMNRLAKI